MNQPEALILDKINKAGKTSIEGDWLVQVYSPNLSIKLKQSITERIGIMSKEGWILIKLLIKQHGIQPDLIHAAGICHHREAKDWLLKLLKSNEEFAIEILHALKCWGGYLSISFFQSLLSDPNESKRLAGLELLKFKAYQLSENELLDLTEELLKDSSDTIIIAAIKVLQKRDGVHICNQIVQVAQTRSYKVAYAAIIALGAIATESSYKGLIQLKQNLSNEKLQDVAIKQINHQYRFSPETNKKTINPEAFL